MALHESEAKVAVGYVDSVEDSGSTSDDHDVGQFGYKPELERRFGVWAMMGISCTIMVTWEGWLVVSNVSLINGGKAGAVYGFLFGWIGYLLVFASLSELCSMIPTAGGQYHWVYVLAPQRSRKFLSWLTGWQIVLGWQADLASVIYLAATLIQGLAVLNYGYDVKRWHGTLIIWGLILFTLCMNTLLAKLLPLFEGVVLVTHCLLFFVVLIPLVYYGSHASASEVFAEFQTYGGYSQGLAFFVGLLTTVFAFIGADGAVHLCEEVKNARKVVPNTLMLSIVLNGLLGFGIVVAVLFTIGDIGLAFENATSGFVFVNYFANVLGSNAWATGLTSCLLVMIVSATVALLTSTSRVTWAFARDNGLPGSSWLRKVSSSTHLPLPSILISGVISFLLSFINIGSAVAFNAIVSLVVAAFIGSYFIPIVVMIWRRLTGQPLHFGPWSLGRLGLPINILAVIWLIIVWVFSFFPVAIPVTPEVMNWSCLIWGVVVLGGIMWYLVYQRRHFSGPNVVMGTMTVN